MISTHFWPPEFFFFCQSSKICLLNPGGKIESTSLKWAPKSILSHAAVEGQWSVWELAWQKVEWHHRFIGRALSPDSLSSSPLIKKKTLTPIKPFWSCSTSGKMWNTNIFLWQLGSARVCARTRTHCDFQLDLSLKGGCTDVVHQWKHITRANKASWRQLDAGFTPVLSIWKHVYMSTPHEVCLLVHVCRLFSGGHNQFLFLHVFYVGFSNVTHVFPAGVVDISHVG